ncbi:MAG: hypothetical protein HY434_02715 [Candidatus Liptonbacteria bacterium]|nr:hypothetical protein [Candidatus Liptonbacteria bacterium]
MPLKIRLRQEQIVGSCTIVQFVAPERKTTYSVLYEDKSEDGKPSVKYSFPFGVTDPTDETTWQTATRELLEELFDAPILETEEKLKDLREELGDAEKYATTARSADEIRGEIDTLELRLEEMRRWVPADAEVTEDDFVGEFVIKNDRGIRPLHFCVFTIELPADTEIRPGKEQFEAHKMTAAQIDDLARRGEFFKGQATAWALFKSYKNL